MISPFQSLPVTYLLLEPLLCALAALALLLSEVCFITNLPQALTQFPLMLFLSSVPRKGILLAPITSVCLAVLLQPAFLLCDLDEAPITPNLII